MVRAASSRARIAEASRLVIVLFGPRASSAIETWHAGMLGSCWSSHRGGIVPSPSAPQRAGSNRPPSPRHAAAAAANAAGPAPMRPAPNVTPRRSGSSDPTWTPPSSAARCAAWTPSCTSRLIDLKCLRLCRRSRAGSNPRTSATNPQWSPPARANASCPHAGPTPPAPNRRPCQNASRPTPIGEETPTPVMTTRGDPSGFNPARRRAEERTGRTRTDDGRGSAAGRAAGNRRASAGRGEVGGMTMGVVLACSADRAPAPHDGSSPDRSGGINRRRGPGEGGSDGRVRPPRPSAAKGRRHDPGRRARPTGRVGPASCPHPPHDGRPRDAPRTAHPTAARATGVAGKSLSNPGDRPDPRPTANRPGPPPLRSLTDPIRRRRGGAVNLCGSGKGGNAGRGGVARRSPRARPLRPAALPPPPGRRPPNAAPRADDPGTVESPPAAAYRVTRRRRRLPRRRAEAPARSPRGCGGIGRRAGFRFPSRERCGFESRQPQSGLFTGPRRSATAVGVDPAGGRGGRAGAAALSGFLSPTRPCRGSSTKSRSTAPSPPSPARGGRTVAVRVRVGKVAPRVERRRRRGSRMWEFATARSSDRQPATSPTCTSPTWRRSRRVPAGPAARRRGARSAASTGRCEAAACRRGSWRRSA